MTIDDSVGRQLPPWRKLLLTAHLIVAVGLPGAAAVLLALGIAGLNGADPATVYPAMHIVARAVVVPLALLALLTGLAQGLLTAWGVVRHWWVTLKLVFTASLTAVALFVLTPRSGAAADAATAVADAQVPQDDRFRLVLFPAIAALVLVTNVVLGVYKPLGRLARRR